MPRLRRKIRWIGRQNTLPLMTMNEFIEYEKMVELDDAKWDLLEQQCDWQGQHNDIENKAYDKVKYLNWASKFNVFESFSSY